MYTLLWFESVGVDGAGKRASARVCVCVLVCDREIEGESTKEIGVKREK